MHKNGAVFTGWLTHCCTTYCINMPMCTSIPIHYPTYCCISVTTVAMGRTLPPPPTLTSLAQGPSSLHQSLPPTSVALAQGKFVGVGTRRGISQLDLYMKLQWRIQGEGAKGAMAPPFHREHACFILYKNLKHSCVTCLEYYDEISFDCPHLCVQWRPTSSA